MYYLCQFEVSIEQIQIHLRLKLRELVCFCLIKMEKFEGQHHLPKFIVPKCYDKRLKLDLM